MDIAKPHRIRVLNEHQTPETTRTRRGVWSMLIVWTGVAMVIGVTRGFAVAAFAGCALAVLAWFTIESAGLAVIRTPGLRSRVPLLIFLNLAGLAAVSLFFGRFRFDSRGLLLGVSALPLGVISGSVLGFLRR